MTLNKLKELIDERVEQGYGERTITVSTYRADYKPVVLVEPYYSDYYEEEMISLAKV